MNVIDVLAILPYYVSLFLMEPDGLPDPTSLQTTTESSPVSTVATPPPHDEEGGASFDDVRRIIQVRTVKYVTEWSRVQIPADKGMGSNSGTWQTMSTCQTFGQHRWHGRCGLMSDLWPMFFFLPNLVLG